MLFSFENIYRQYINCRRNKRNTINALKFEINQEQNLMELKEALESRTYKPSRSVCFFSTRPKLREIFAADFRDRIVHHILVNYLERIWEPIFILISKLFSAIIQKQFCPSKVLGAFQSGDNCLPDFVVLAGNQDLFF